MNLIFGELIQIFEEDGMRFGKVRVCGAAKKVALDLVADAGRGDRVLLCDGVAISKVRDAVDENYVPRDSG